MICKKDCNWYLNKKRVIELKRSIGSVKKFLNSNPESALFVFDGKISVF